MAIANYLASKERLKTAYVELNPSGQIQSLSKHQDKNHFSFQGIHFFAQVKPSQLSKILQYKFDIFILDFGVYSSLLFYTFLRCDIQFMVGDFSQWRRMDSLNQLEYIQNTYQLNHKQVTLLDNTITKESFYSKIGNPPLRNYRVPLISNPFHIASFDFAFYESLWRSINIP